ncbi:MAG: replicative DNA helicase, partial [Deltaproteobacteria bacterium]|nr:replicative DNA helicase [Deltaproteobacteria bacterium]
MAVGVKNRGEGASLRVPPHNLEAEQAVLGGILLEKDSINKVLEILSHDGSDFYNGVNGEILKAMISLFEKNTPIDVVTLTDIFKETKVLDSVGGLPYIIEVVERTPTAANIGYYAKIVREKALLRNLIRAG